MLAGDIGGVPVPEAIDVPFDIDRNADTRIRHLMFDVRLPKDLGMRLQLEQFPPFQKA
jgi:hypothetical protein